MPFTLRGIRLAAVRMERLAAAWFPRLERSACSRSELRYTLRADTEQGGYIAHRQAPCYQLSGSLAGASGGSGGEFISLSA
jgi:hypothetical protein